MIDRVVGWIVCGPVGHLVAGVLDVGELLVRWYGGRALARVRGR